MKKIYLHVGTHKTGSTTIQRSLYDNISTLAEHGIHYLSNGPNHWRLYLAFMDEPWNWFEAKRMKLNKLKTQNMREEVLQDTISEISSSTASTIVISSEYLSLLNRDNLIRLKDYLQGLGEVHIIYFSRQLINWMASDSQQCAKVGMNKVPTTYTTAILRLYDYPMKFIEVFGVKNFKMIRFEDAVETGLVKSLLQVIQPGCPVELELSELKANTSVSSEAVKMFFLLNKHMPLLETKRSKTFTDKVASIPGEKHLKIALTKTEIADHNIKSSYLKENYGFRMYDDLADEAQIEDEMAIRPESIAFLLKSYNDLCFEHKNSVQPKLTELNIDLIRDSAQELEKSNPIMALHLMQLAHEMRPSGDFIKNKIHAYKKNLTKQHRSIRPKSPFMALLARWGKK